MLMKMIFYVIYCFFIIFMVCFLLKIYNIIMFFVYLDMIRLIEIVFCLIFKNLNIFGFMYFEYMLC